MYRQRMLRMVAVALVALGFALGASTPAAYAGRSSRGTLSSIGGP
jgi:hypothetical protein